MLGSPGGQCVEPEAFGEGCVILQVQSSGWGRVGTLSEQQPGSRSELPGTERASLRSSGREDSKPKGGEEVYQCPHSCRDNRLTKARRFVKKRGFFFFTLSSSEDVVAGDFAGWLCMQKKVSGGACLSNNSFLQE